MYHPAGILRLLERVACNNNYIIIHKTTALDRILVGNRIRRIERMWSLIQLPEVPEIRLACRAVSASAELHVIQRYSRVTWSVHVEQVGVGVDLSVVVWKRVVFTWRLNTQVLTCARWWQADTVERRRPVEVEPLKHRLTPWTHLQSRHLTSPPCNQHTCTYTYLSCKFLSAGNCLAVHRVDQKRAVLARYVVLVCRADATSMTSVRPSVCVCLTMADCGEKSTTKSINRNMTGQICPDHIISSDSEFCWASPVCMEFALLRHPVIQRLTCRADWASTELPVVVTHIDLFKLQLYRTYQLVYLYVCY